MSNESNPVNQAPYYPPYGYPYFVPQGEPMQNTAVPQSAWPPQPLWYPQMAPGYFPPGYFPSGAGIPPQMMAPPHAGHHHSAAPGMDWGTQVENIMGEQAGLLKGLISTLGADDKEFWKGAMMGAAVTLLLTNDNVRQMLTQTLSSAGDLLKTGGTRVKETVASGAENVKETVATGSTIFRDTVSAGKAGFHESVERHRATQPTMEETPDEQQP